MRLDQILVHQKKFTSRNKAQIAISKGEVSLANGKILQKASLDLDPGVELMVKETEHYVSRAAYKLLKAIDTFQISYSDKLVLDIGASTGGFTQVALEHGAATVYALDVGSNQLAPVLVEDQKVKVIEHYNFRYAKEEDFPSVKFDIIQCDVSFISLKYIVLPAVKLLKDHGTAIFLIKPQFEAGPTHLGKNGVVKDRKVRKQVLQDTLELFAEHNLSVKGLVRSPIKGSKGNIEYLAYCCLNGAIHNYSNDDLMALAK